MRGGLGVGIAGGAIVAAISCTAAGPAGHASRDSVAVAAVPADSLVALGPRGLEIWYTMARQDHTADGATCTDRTIEIRRDTTRIPVPLLYTEEAPRIVNDPMLDAVLYRGCGALDRYRVDLRTGQPTPVRPAS